MPRITVISLHGVIDDIPEELRRGRMFPDRSRRLAFFHLAQHGDLLLCAKVGKQLSVEPRLLWSTPASPRRYVARRFLYGPQSCRSMKFTTPAHEAPGS